MEDVVAQEEQRMAEEREVTSSPSNQKEQLMENGQPKDDDDDLEEGELKDDDDDDDDEEEDDKTNFNGRSAKSSSSDENTPERPASSSSSSSSSSTSSSSSPSSSSNESKDHLSSKSSSKMSSQKSSSSKNHLSVLDRLGKTKAIPLRLEENHRISVTKDREREREDPSEKAAKLISMRTKLLEARSREIEMKFQKNKGRISPPPPLATPLLITSKTVGNVKMTIAKPSISYSENPNPPAVLESAIVLSEEENKKKSKSKAKPVDKDKKSKKKLKKKKKVSAKKHKKRKASSSSSSSSSSSCKKNSSIDISEEEPAKELELPYDNLDHQGPRTPPDNHVTTLEDEQIEWPSRLIRMTVASPSISYSVNPSSVLELVSNENRKDILKQKRRRSTLSSPSERKRQKSSEKYSPPLSPHTPGTLSPTTAHKTRSYSSQRKLFPSRTNTNEIDLNQDYAWFYDYYISSHDMSPQQAEYQAHYSVIALSNHDKDVLERWLNAKGMSMHFDDEYQKQVFPFSLRDDVECSTQDSQANSPKKVEVHNSIDVKADQSCSTQSPNYTDKMKIEKIVTKIARNKVVSDNESSLLNQLQRNSTVEDNNQRKEVETSDDDVENKTDPDNLNLNEDPSRLQRASLTDKGNEHFVKLEQELLDPNSNLASTPSNPLSLRAIQPKFTVIRSRKEIVLPNGQVLPPGTIQKIVHPYPRLDSEILGPHYDLY